jgi:hypothetical protein
MVARSVCWRAGASRTPASKAPRALSRCWGDLGRRQQRAAGGRQLDRQRQPVEASADLGHRAGVVAVELDGWVKCPCARREQLDGASLGARHRERRHGHACLGLQGERFAAGGEHGDAWAVRRQAPDERRGIQHVLAVVQHEQQVLGQEEALDRLLGRLAGQHDDPERADDRRRDVLGPLHRGKRHEPRAVFELPLGRARRLQREPRLANAARPGECQQPYRLIDHACGDGRDLALTTDRRVGWGRHAGSHITRFGGPAARRLEARIMGKDRLLKLSQLGTWLDAQLVHEGLARVPIGVERLGLPAAAIQGEHALCVQALAPRVLARKLVQLAGEIGMAPGGEVGVDAQLEGREALLFQPRDLRRRERQRSELGKRRPSP